MDHFRSVCSFPNVLLTLCLEKFANISRMKIHFKIHLESFIYYFTLMTVNKVLGKLPKVLRDASLLYKWTLSDPPTLFLSFLACFPPSILPLHLPCSNTQKFVYLLRFFLRQLTLFYSSIIFLSFMAPFTFFDLFIQSNYNFDCDNIFLFIRLKLMQTSWNFSGREEFFLFTLR